MAAQNLKCLLLCSIAFAFVLTSSCTHPPISKPRNFVIPVLKDKATLQYYANFVLGSSHVSMKLVIHVGGPFLWYDCDAHYNSSSYQPLPCGSQKCDIPSGSGCLDCPVGFPLKPGCTNNTCGAIIETPFSFFIRSGGMAEDVVGIPVAGYSLSSLSRVYLSHYMSVCADSDRENDGGKEFLKGLAKGAKGMVGLARTQSSLPVQLALTYKLPRKFALCLPSQSSKSRSGHLQIGAGPYSLPPYNEDVSHLLAKTELLINPVSTGTIYMQGDASIEYFIGVKSIKMDGEMVLGFNSTSLLSIDEDGNGGTKISTLNPYTVLQSSIYEALIRDFTKKATLKNITRVAAVKPFGACFDSKTIGNRITGPAVPDIDLWFQEGKGYWRIYGANSMVKVGKNVMCLAFEDGGSNTRTSIVIGGHQLSDNLLEFDLDSSKFGISSSLLAKSTSCSNFRRSI